MVMNTAYAEEMENPEWSTEAPSDIPAEEWYTATVLVALDKGIIKGYQDQTIRPNNKITRAEAAQIIQNVLKDKEFQFESESENELEFKDVAQQDWFRAAVEANVAAGIIKGKSETTFAPNDNLNRAEAAALMNRIRMSLVQE